MASCISLVAMAILATVLLAPGSTDGRQRSLDTVGSTALDAPARQVRREAGKGDRKNKKASRRTKTKSQKENDKNARNNRNRKNKNRNNKNRNNKNRKKSGRKNQPKKTVKIPKKENGQSKIQPETRKEDKFDHCDYLDLMEVGTRRADCGPGGKFLFKVGFHSHPSISSTLSFPN